MGRAAIRAEAPTEAVGASAFKATRSVGETMISAGERIRSLAAAPLEFGSRPIVDEFLPGSRPAASKASNRSPAVGLRPSNVGTNSSSKDGIIEGTPGK